MFEEETASITFTEGSGINLGWFMAQGFQVVGVQTQKKDIKTVTETTGTEPIEGLGGRSMTASGTSRQVTTRPLMEYTVDMKRTRLSAGGALALIKDLFFDELGEAKQFNTNLLEQITSMFDAAKADTDDMDFDFDVDDIDIDLEFGDLDTMLDEASFAGGIDALANMSRGMLDRYIATFEQNGNRAISDYKREFERSLDGFARDLRNRIAAFYTRGINLIAEYQSGIAGHISGLDSSLRSRVDSFEQAAQGYLDDFGQSRIDDINREFDAELEKARQSLINRGMYNSTTWEAMSAGIEKSRERALNDLHDKLADRKFTGVSQLHQNRSGFEERLVDRKLSAEDKVIALRTQFEESQINRIIQFESMTQEQRIRMLDSIVDKQLSIIAAVFSARAAYEQAWFQSYMRSQVDVAQLANDVQKFVLGTRADVAKLSAQLDVDIQKAINDAAIRVATEKQRGKISLADFRSRLANGLGSALASQKAQVPRIGELGSSIAAIGLGVPR